MQARLQQCPPSFFWHVCILLLFKARRQLLQLRLQHRGCRLGHGNLAGQWDARRHRSGKGQCFCRPVKLALVVCLPLCVRQFAHCLPATIICMVSVCPTATRFIKAGYAGEQLAMLSFVCY